MHFNGRYNSLFMLPENIVLLQQPDRNLYKGRDLQIQKFSVNCVLYKDFSIIKRRKNQSPILQFATNKMKEQGPLSVVLRALVLNPYILKAILTKYIMCVTIKR